MSKEEKIQVGRVVQLKSGGPNMTVTAKRKEDGKITCQWFDDAKHREASFPSDALRNVGELSARLKDMKQELKGR